MSKLIKCPACGQEIAKGAKCPHCGHDSRSFFAKHKIITVLLVLIVIGAIGSALGSGKDEPKKVAENNSAAASAKETKTDTKKTYKKGDVIELKGMRLSVTDVQKSNGTEFEKPKSGMEFVIVTVKIENKGKDTIAYNPLYFKVKNSKGQITDETFSTINKDTALNSGDLAANGEVTGSIIFEEPKDDKNLQLQFQDDIFTKDSAIDISLQ